MTDNKPQTDQSKDAEDPTPAELPNKTPFYTAVHAARYQRQEAIRGIEATTGRNLICYVGGSHTSIHRDDVLGFADMLHNCPPNGDLDLLLHTGGGDVDAAEKLITIVRSTVGTGSLRIIVPDYAKSAGTLMALGGDSIVMSDTSELGPIDPQIVLADSNGNRIAHSAQDYIEAYRTHKEALDNDPNNITSRVMLSKLDPATVKMLEKVMNRSEKFAGDMLHQHMFKEPGSGNWSLAASELINTAKWHSHGQMISWETASSIIGLVVDYRPPDDPVWDSIWRLYCLQRLEIEDNQKLFESNYTFLKMDGRA